MDITQQKAVGVTVGISLCTVLVFVLFGLLARDPIGFTGPLGFFATVFALVWAAAIGCAYAMLHSFTPHRHVITGIAALATILAGLFSIPAIVGGILVWVFLASAARMIAGSTKERTTIRLVPILIPGLRFIFVGLALAIAAFLLPLVRTQVSSGGVMFSTSTLDLLLRPATPILEGILPGYTPEATVDQLIDRQLRQQEQSLPPGVSISPGQRVQVRQELSQRFGLRLTGSETIADILAAYVNTYIQRLGDRSGVLVIIVLLALGFLAVRAVVPLFAWTALVIAIGLFWLARRFELVRIAHIQAPIEHLQF